MVVSVNAVMENDPRDAGTDQDDDEAGVARRDVSNNQADEQNGNSNDQAVSWERV